MYDVDRLQEILKILSEKKSASVRHLAQCLYVSDATVRRDLNTLERRGQVRRIFGGVVLIENGRRDVPFYTRSPQFSDVQSRIALKAVERILNGQIVMMDASSTACALIPHLRRFQGLTVITNAAVPMTGLQDLDAKVYVTGGLMLRNSQGYVGSYAEDMVRNFNADLLFFSCGGIADDGRVSDNIGEETAIRRVMLRHAKKKILLCDSGKFGKECCYNLCTTNDVDEIISEMDDLEMPPPNAT